MRGFVISIIRCNFLCRYGATKKSYQMWYDYYENSYNYAEYVVTIDYYNSKALASKSSFKPTPQMWYHYREAEDYRARDETDGDIDSVEPDPTITKGDVDLHDILFPDYGDEPDGVYDSVEHDHIITKGEGFSAGRKGYSSVFCAINPYRDASMDTSHLIETYTYSLPDNVFEVVLVTYEECYTFKLDIPTINVLEKFEYYFSRMPWTAIPFPDINSRERLASMFGIQTQRRDYSSFVIDSTGMVLQSYSCELFHKYGGLGYPFSDERLEFLKSEAYATAKGLSIRALLSSPKRDYLISNKGNKV